jgi:hypothetical protein
MIHKILNLLSTITDIRKSTNIVREKIKQLVKKRYKWRTDDLDLKASRDTSPAVQSPSIVYSNIHTLFSRSYQKHDAMQSRSLCPAVPSGHARH